MEGLHEDSSKFHCRRCNRPDAAESQMVACDKCNQWEHFGCAGVNESVKSRPFNCRECMHGENSKATKADGKSNRAGKSVTSKRTKKTVSHAPVSVSSSARVALLEAQMKLLEEEQLMKEKAAQEQEAIREREHEEKRRQIEEKKKLMEEEKMLRELKLAEDKKFQAKQAFMRQESLEQKRQLLQQIAESSKGGSSTSSIISNDEKVKDWLKAQNREAVKEPERGMEHVIRRPTKPPSHQASGRHPVEDLQAALSAVDLIEQRSVPRVPAPHNTSTPKHPSAPEHMLISEPLRFGNTSQGLSRHVDTPALLGSQQIAAKQVMGKELPIFSGNPEDWPIFISSFEQSTATCGFSDAENLVRLQRCLKGHALESVKSRLLLPSGVPHVINTLRTLYGRPELLIRALLKKVRQVQAPRHDKLETIMEFGLAVQNLVDHLDAAHQENHLANPVLMQELVEKLPGTLRLDWAVYKCRDAIPTLRTFGDFMTRLVTAASEVTFELPSDPSSVRPDRPRQKERAHIQAHFPEPSPGYNRKPVKVCVVCDREGHRVSECFTFKAMSVDERWQIVQQRGLCRTCLNTHGKWPCKSWQGCEHEGCRLKHHSLLHPPSVSHSVNVSSTISQTEFSIPFFRIIPVVLYEKNCSQLIFAFIDEGSSSTLLEEAVAKKLGAFGPTEPLTLQWTGNVTRDERKSQSVQLQIAGKNSDVRHPLVAHTVSRLELPHQSLKYRELADKFPHLRGLPIDDYELVQPKILVGLDNLHLGVPLKLRQGQPSEPIAAKCKLGWGVYGDIPNSPPCNAVVSLHVSAIADSDRILNEQLHDYFALENMGVNNSSDNLESEEDMQARALLEKTTRRTKNGFETGLLWRNGCPNFPDSYAMAVRRLQSLERRLLKEPQLHDKVCQQIEEYQLKGYAHKASNEELFSVDPKRIWYLPLGVVVNPKKPNKVRLIWDAAEKCAGVSFNSQLLKGPDLLTPLPTVLSQFRQFPIAVCGDIKEMFHQITIREPDRQSQRFLWRNKSTDLPQVFVMNVATFGSTCSPASAQYVKNTNAQELSDQFPRAAEAIQKKTLRR